MSATALAEALAKVLPEDCIACDPEALGRHAHDETEDLVHPPELVASPRTEAQVREVLAFASAHAIPVTPQGARTGLSGGALAARGGLALDLTRMNRILEIDTENLFAVVEPGVVTQTLHEAVEAVGLFYPPDPASRGSCTIG
ncbi:MAG TPA: FAD-binding oxidoreductase, partial [Thermoanaerobaculia bacterium]